MSNKTYRHEPTTQVEMQKVRRQMRQQKDLRKRGEITSVGTAHFSGYNPYPIQPQTVRSNGVLPHLSKHDQTVIEKARLKS